ncbi:hypothetical protein [Asticcacaulis sp. YBE204]|uniref:hypothetical protein n=1 Tax=Asticcacaulis sp. YBE204 TaxID=1282363 RepID=UPI0003C3B5F9|nr:hypothetical protein [Asticcacaulis sp. YBE204]ESQ77514.1 hypothetical protein AEYBE204_17390 [Asticcacaulis sp. YBE204]
MKAWIGWVAGGALLAAGTAWACQPCQERLPLADSIARADLIAVVEATSNVPDNPQGEDKYITVAVERSLKGKSGSKTISVRSWHGMCPYGLFMTKGSRAVVLLTGSGSGYESLSAVCGAGGFGISDGKVTVEGEALTVDAFATKYITSPQP